MRWCSPGPSLWKNVRSLERYEQGRIGRGSGRLWAVVAECGRAVERVADPELRRAAWSEPSTGSFDVTRARQRKVWHCAVHRRAGRRSSTPAQWGVPGTRSESGPSTRQKVERWNQWIVSAGNSSGDARKPGVCAPWNCDLKGWQPQWNASVRERSTGVCGFSCGDRRTNGRPLHEVHPSSACGSFCDGASDEQISQQAESLASRPRRARLLMSRARQPLRGA